MKDGEDKADWKTQDQKNGTVVGVLFVSLVHKRHRAEESPRARNANQCKQENVHTTKPCFPPKIQEKAN